MCYSLVNHTYAFPFFFEVRKSKSEKEFPDLSHSFLYIFQESYAAAQSLRESSLQAISWILTSVPTIGAQYLEQLNEVII